MQPKITNSGIGAMIQILDGESTLTFTRIGMGNGPAPSDYRTLTELQNEVASVSITALTLDNQQATIEAAYVNDALDDPFSWTEVGIFATDPNDANGEILYAYAHYEVDGDADPEVFVPSHSQQEVEIQLTYKLFIGSLTDIEAIIADSTTVTRQMFDDHVENYNNPHQVTAAQVGLGNVPNVATNNQTPTYSQAGSLAALSSGEILSTALGKLAKAVSTLISHLADTTMHVTSTERTTWNSKANGSHNHSATDITSGALPINRGGTGASSRAAAVENLGLKDALLINTRMEGTSHDGYIHFKNGWTIEWGRVEFSNFNANETKTSSISLLGNCPHVPAVIAQAVTTDPTDKVASVSSVTSSSFVLRCKSASSSSGSTYVYWIAIGN